MSLNGANLNSPVYSFLAPKDTLVDFATDISWVNETRKLIKAYSFQRNPKCRQELSWKFTQAVEG